MKGQCTEAFEWKEVHKYLHSAFVPEEDEHQQRRSHQPSELDKRDGPELEGPEAARRSGGAAERVGFPGKAHRDQAKAVCNVNWDFGWYIILNTAFMNLDKGLAGGRGNKRQDPIEADIQIIN